MSKIRLKKGRVQWVVIDADYRYHKPNGDIAKDGDKFIYDSKEEAVAAAQFAFYRGFDKMRLSAVVE